MRVLQAAAPSHLEPTTRSRSQHACAAAVVRRVTPTQERLVQTRRLLQERQAEGLSRIALLPGKQQRGRWQAVGRRAPGWQR